MIWNPISKAHEIVVKGKMVSFDTTEGELFTTEHPYLSYYRCEVLINYPIGEPEIINADMWRTTADNHPYLTIKDAEIYLRVQIISKDEIYVKVEAQPPQLADLTKLLSSEDLKARGPSIPRAHRDKWWNKIIR